MGSRSEQVGKSRSAREIIRTYLIITGLYTLSASLIWAINTLFLLDAGLNVFGVFVVNAVFTGAMAVFEIPTGVYADLKGRRRSFLASIPFLLVGTLGYVGAAEFGGGLLVFGGLSVLLGLGYAFYSGALEAWLVDALALSNFDGSLDSVFARSSIVTGAAMLLGTIGGGFIGAIDLSLPFLIRSVLLASLLIIGARLIRETQTNTQPLRLRQLPQAMRRVAQVGINYGWNNNALRYLIIASFIIGSFMAWGFYAWQPYFLQLLGQDLVWVTGIIAALVALAMIAGNSVVEYFAQFCGRRTTLLIVAAMVAAIATIGVGITESFSVAVGLYLLVMFAVGIYTPVKQAFLHEATPTEQRATVVSFDSLVSNGGSMIGQAGLGYLAQMRSFGLGYVTGGIVLLLLMPVLSRLRAISDPADVLVGPACNPSPSAARGVPSISSVAPEEEPPVVGHAD